METAKSMATRGKRNRNRRIMSVEAKLYCIFLIMLFAFICFIVFLLIVEHNEKESQAESELYFEFELEMPEANISDSDLLVEKSLEIPSLDETPTEIMDLESDSDTPLETSPVIVSVPEEAVTESPDFIIPVTEEDIGLIVQAVQHEVGSHQSYYPWADIDKIQQCMARVIINQVGRPDCGYNIYDVLFHPGHFTNIERLYNYDPEEPTTLKNVMTVLRGEDNQSSEIIFEMSFVNSTLDESLEIMEKQVGSVNPYFWTTTADDRLLVFAEPI